MNNISYKHYAAMTSVLVVIILSVLAVIWVQTLPSCVYSAKKNIYANMVSAPAEEKQAEVKPVAYAHESFQSSYAKTVHKRIKSAADLNQDEPQSAQPIETKDSFAITEPESIPREYTQVQYPYIDYPLYVFLDQNGVAHYRVSAERTRNNERQAGFIEAVQGIQNLRITIEYDENAPFVDTDKEAYGIISREDAPESEIGMLNKEYGMTGTYYKTTASGEKEYYVYGHYTNKPSSFFEADEAGNPIPGSMPLTGRPWEGE